MIRAILLDLDGMFGLRQIEAARMLVEVYSLPDQPSVLGREKEEYQLRHLDGRIKPMPGLFDLLNEIGRRELRTAVDGILPSLLAVREALASLVAE